MPQRNLYDLYLHVRWLDTGKDEELMWTADIRPGADPAAMIPELIEFTSKRHRGRKFTQKGFRATRRP